MKPPPYRASPATMSNNNNNNNQHRNGEASSPSAAVNVEIFAAGDGIHYPKKGHTVTIHYAAFLGTENGELFDSSRTRKKPFRFKLFTEQVIPGLEDGISQLSIGERAKIHIPSKYAYGTSGFPGLVPKNCDLVFDVELIDFH